MRVIGADAPESIVELQACHLVGPPMAIGEGGLGV
jgi:hypothetical protein